MQLLKELLGASKYRIIKKLTAARAVFASAVGMFVLTRTSLTSVVGSPSSSTHVTLNLLTTTPASTESHKQQLQDSSLEALGSRGYIGIMEKKMETTV